MQDATTIPDEDSNKEVAKSGRKLAPKITKATPRLDPELRPKT